MYPVVFFKIGIAAAIIKITVSKKKLTGIDKAGIFLLYLIIMCIGVEGIFAFLAHTLKPDFIAEQIGWPTGSPFQFEIAVANLSYGVLGFLCILIKGRFWMAVVIGNSIFLWGAAYGHFVQMLKGDRSPYNSGIFLYTGDIIIPLIIFILMIYYFRSQKKTPILENN